VHGSTVLSFRLEATTMSDRIDELVAAIDANTLLQWDGKDVALVAAHELATIARKAEVEADKWRKVAEWLAMDGGLWSPAGAAKRIAHVLAAAEQEEAE
jgi:hypothetical protein